MEISFTPLLDGIGFEFLTPLLSFISMITTPLINIITRIPIPKPIMNSWLEFQTFWVGLPAIQFSILCLIMALGVMILMSYLTTYLFGPDSYRNSKVYINDFVVFKEFPKEWTTSLDAWIARQLNVFRHDPEAVSFTHKLLERSGISPDNQHVAPGIISDPPDFTIASARYEAEVVMFHCVEQILSRNNLAAHDIDILIVNCSLFNPTPSLCAMIINKFKFREDIITYNLSGMGCSASPLAVQLASTNLKLHPKKSPLAIVMSLECLSSHLYHGSQREFLLSNALFRMNGAAVLLSRDSVNVLGRPAPKWRIDQLERIHLGPSDKAFQAIHLDNDNDNYLGVRLSKDLIKEAARGVAINLTILAPKILPYHELIRTGLRMGVRALTNFLSPPKKLSNTTGDSSNNNDHGKDHIASKSTKGKDGSSNSTSSGSNSAANNNNGENNSRIVEQKEKPIVPNFKTCVDYWLIHAGGKAVITGIKDSLNLTEDDVKESRDVLYKYGNTSSSSIWYELDEVEMNHDIKTGEKALAIALGSGIKVQSMYLTAVNRG